MKKVLKALSLVLVVALLMSAMALVLVACKKDCGVGNHTDENHDGVCDVCKKPSAFKHVDVNGDKVCDTCGKGIRHSYNTYITVTPSNWNEMDYADENDTAILGYIGSAFFEYDYDFGGKKFNADGSINFDGIVEGGFDVKYSAATALADVTKEFGDEWGLTEKQIAAGGYIWKITLRNDLKWDDGTPIKAKDFVYTMKEQLNPNFQLTRADSYYNNAVKIHNAKDYFYQGQKGWFAANLPYTNADITEELKSEIVWKMGFEGELGGGVNSDLREYYTKAYGASYGIGPDLGPGAWLLALDNLFGGALAAMGVTSAQIDALEGKTLAEIEADPALNATYESIMEWWVEDEETEGVLDFSIVQYEYPAVDFEDVGIFAQGDLDIILVCDSPMEFFKEDGTLSYLAAYNFSSLPLVKESLYEKCKQEPQLGSTLWTQNYNTSLETTASWGPYKLTYFQAGKQFILERNEHWYGWNLADNAGQYQADRIVYEVIAQNETAQLAFWAGEVDGLGIDVTLKDDYRNSEYAVYTPADGTFGIQIYGNLSVLKNNGRNNGILAIREFRGALSLALDRADYNATVYTSHQPNLGIMGPAYYYDVENGLTYRGSEAGKKALLRSYGFTENEDHTWTDGTTGNLSLDDAYDAMTGYNLTLAKQWLEEAYTILTADPEYYGYDATKKITIVFGTSVDNASTRRQYNYFTTWLKNLTDGTSLQGKVELTFDASPGDKWADDFREGKYEFAAGTGFGGAVFDPFYMVGSSLNYSSISYHKYWDLDGTYLTMLMPEGDYEGAGEEQSLSLRDWYDSLNGNMTENPSFNWGVSSDCPTEVRLEILAMLEEYIIGQYNFIITTSEYGASLHSAKWSYASDTYNVMMGFGGLQYMQFNFADDEWAAFVAERNGDLRDFYKG